MGKVSRLKRLTVQRRIMLLLYDHQKHVDSYEVPVEVTQAGIAAEHALRQNHVSRALAELTSDGMIFSRTSHIKGAPRRKKVYFLTQLGVKEVQGFIHDISQKTVLVRTPKGELVECTLEKASDVLGEKMGHTPSYHTVLSKHFDGSELDVSLIEEEAKPKTQIEKRLDRPFYGRVNECSSVLHSVRKEGRNFTVIVSMAGQGKTALLTEVVSSLKDRPISWTSLNEWVHPSDLLNEWADLLKRHGRKGLYNHLDTTRKVDLKEALGLFLIGTRSIRPVIIVDDFHKASEDVTRLFKLLKTLTQMGDKTSFLIASRARPGFYGKKDVLVSKQVKEIELAGLDKESSEMILREKGIGEAIPTWSSMHSWARRSSGTSGPWTWTSYASPVSSRHQCIPGRSSTDQRLPRMFWTLSPADLF
jgi:predicted transcriptional regulator